MLNYETEQVDVIYKFEHKLNRVPHIFEPTQAQDLFLVASPEDGFFLDFRSDPNGEESAFIDDYHISVIESVTYDEEDMIYYIMCNKFDDKLGLFVLKVDPKNPKGGIFLIKWKNRLDIDDSSIDIMRDEVTGLKELILAFKIIYINVYSVFAVDISVEDTEAIQFRHESFQMFESECTGLMLNNETRDFVHCNNTGMYVMSFMTNKHDSQQTNGKKSDNVLIDKRRLVDDRGSLKMLHSIESCNFLRLDPQNYVHLECQDENEYYVTIKQEYIKD